MNIAKIASSYSKTNNKPTISKVNNKPQKNDIIELKNNNNTSRTDSVNNSKVTFKEGLRLVGKGFASKLKNIAASVVKHPVKTAAIIGASVLAMYALPFIGISTAVGTSALAIGCAGIAVGKTAYHTTKAIKDNKNGEYANMRNDLQNIGGDCMDLTLSLPFVPKAIKNIKRNIQFAPSIGLNKELITNIKNTKGLNAKCTELLKGNLKINYETMGNEMGFQTKPKLVFDDTMQFNLKKGVLSGEYNIASGELKVNTKMLNPINQFLTKTKLEAILKHELTHFKQFADISKTEGLGISGLEDVLCKYYKKSEELGIIAEEQMEIAKKIISGDKSGFNSEFYSKIVQEQGTIPAGSTEAIKAQEYANGLIAKVTTQIDEINKLNINSILGPSHSDMEKILEIYKSNPIEKPAYTAQEAITKDLKPGIINDIISELSVTSNAK